MDSPRPNLDIRCPADETAGGRASAGWRSRCRMANFGGAMNAIELLRRQHREIERLFAQAKQGAGAGELLDALALHAAIEEQQFYPATRAVRSDDELRTALDEHLAIKQLMADLIACDPADPQFDVRLDLLAAPAKQQRGGEGKKLGH